MKEKSQILLIHYNTGTGDPIISDVTVGSLLPLYIQLVLKAGIGQQKTSIYCRKSIHKEHPISVCRIGHCILSIEESILATL